MLTHISIFSHHRLADLFPGKKLVTMQLKPDIFKRENDAFPKNPHIVMQLTVSALVSGFLVIIHACSRSSISSRLNYQGQLGKAEGDAVLECRFARTVGTTPLGQLFRRDRSHREWESSVTSGLSQSMDSAFSKACSCSLFVEFIHPVRSVDRCAAHN